MDGGRGVCLPRRCGVRHQAREPTRLFQLMRTAEARAFEAILAEDHSRLWRNQAEMHAALKRLRFWRIPVMVASTRIDLTDPMGKLLASVLGWKDETYVEDLGGENPARARGTGASRNESWRQSLWVSERLGY